MPALSSLALYAGPTCCQASCLKHGFPRAMIHQGGYRERVIVAGNPGCGKSSILNCIIGWCAFKSGISIGSGLTTALDTKRVRDVLYSDTPGLDDVHIRERAASEIASAFRNGGKIKLIFVLTLEAGRLRNNDLATMKVILDAIEKVGVETAQNFSVILNKCEPEVLELLKDQKQKAKLEIPINSVAPVDNIGYMPFVHRAAGKPNFLLRDDSTQFKAFVQKAPFFTLPRNEDFSINVEMFNDTVEALKQKVEELQTKLNQYIEQYPKRQKGPFRLFCRRAGRKFNETMENIYYRVYFMF